MPTAVFVKISGVIALNGSWHPFRSFTCQWWNFTTVRRLSWTRLRRLPTKRYGRMRPGGDFWLYLHEHGVDGVKRKLQEHGIDIPVIEPFRAATRSPTSAATRRRPHRPAGHHHLSQAGCLRHRQRPAHRQVRRAHRPGGPGHQAASTCTATTWKSTGKTWTARLRRRIRV